MLAGGGRRTSIHAACAMGMVMGIGMRIAVVAAGFRITFAVIMMHSFFMIFVVSAVFAVLSMVARVSFRFLFEVFHPFQVKMVFVYNIDINVGQGQFRQRLWHRFRHWHWLWRQRNLLFGNDRHRHHRNFLLRHDRRMHRHLFFRHDRRHRHFFFRRGIGHLRTFSFFQPTHTSFLVKSHSTWYDTYPRQGTTPAQPSQKSRARFLVNRLFCYLLTPE